MELETFNDIWYLDCFRHGIAQIAYNNNFLPQLFENDYFEYSFEREEGKPVITIRTKHFLDWSEIFDRNGIEIKACNTSYEFCLLEIKELLNFGWIIMLPVDCFYESIRFDSFNKNHLMHYLLLYGFDDDAQEFLMLEHNYRQDLRYRHLRLSYDSAIKAHLAVPKLQNSSDNFYLAFKKREGTNTFSPNNQNQIRQGIKKFIDSIPALSAFADEFAKSPIPKYPDAAKEYVTFNKTWFEISYNAKKYQSYFYNYVLEKQGEEALKGFSNLGSCNEWAIILGILYKCTLKNEYPEDITDKIYNLLQKIIEKESRWKDVLGV